MRFFILILRPIFYLLYHPFAWSYDFVAAIVSLGQWNDWVRSIIRLIEGQRVLELGHGPGHLQLTLTKRNLQVFGLDESRQMINLAYYRLKKHGFMYRLSRGRAQYLPFPQATFDTIVATFPSEYILDLRTLAEIHRVLVVDGKLLVLFMAWITGKRFIERLMAWLYRFTGESTGSSGMIPSKIMNQFIQAGFDIKNQIVEVKSSTLLLILARKKLINSPLL